MSNFEIKDYRNKRIPILSVLLSFYDDEKTLKKSIKSVIGQSFKDFEIILLSDGSKDRSDKIAKKFINKKNNIIFVKSYFNLGLTKMLNIALRYSRGKYLARHDADDICIKERFKKQVNFLNKNKNIHIVGSNAIYLLDKKKKNIIMPETDFQIKKNLKFRNTLIHSSVMMRSNIFKNTSYDENYDRCQDYDLWLRIKTKVRFHNIQENLIIRGNVGKKFLFKELILTSKARFKSCGIIVSFFSFFKDLIIYFFKLLKLI